MFNNLQGSTLTTWTGGSSTVKTGRMVYDGQNMVLAFDGRRNKDSRPNSRPLYFTYAYDNDSRLTSANNSYHSSENQTYSYDHDSQETSSSGSSTTNYSWSLNGDPNATGISTGYGNRLLSDATYAYTYDDNGNMLTKTSSTAETDYTWDQRNRLITAKIYTRSGGVNTLAQEVDYSYDMFNDLQGSTLKTYNTSGTLLSTTTGRMVYDGQNMVLAFDGTGALTDRYLWGPAVDEIIADEQFSPTTSGQMPLTAAGNINWLLGDNEHTVRDIVTNGSLSDHLVYDSFGALLSQTNSSANERIGYTGTIYDPITGLQYHNDPATGFAGRWYAPSIQRWMSADPTGLAYDSDPYRYCNNSPTVFTDPSGLAGQRPTLPLAKDKVYRISIGAVEVKVTTATGNYKKQLGTLGDEKGIYLSFFPKPGNAGKYKWIQHVVDIEWSEPDSNHHRKWEFATTPRYDNHTLKSTFHFGPESDPTQPSQSLDDKVWYGGPGSPSGSGPSGHSPETPKPQDSIFDRPDAYDDSGNMFISQLVCIAEKGKVYFTYVWYINAVSKKNPMKEWTEDDGKDDRGGNGFWWTDRPSDAS